MGNLLPSIPETPVAPPAPAPPPPAAVPPPSIPATPACACCACPITAAPPPMMSAPVTLITGTNAYVKVWEKVFTAGGTSEVFTVASADTYSSFMIELDGYQTGGGSCKLILNLDPTGRYENMTSKQKPGTVKDENALWKGIMGSNGVFSGYTAGKDTASVDHVAISDGIYLGGTEGAGSLHSVVYLSGASGQEKIATGSWACRQTQTKAGLGNCFAGSISGYYPGTVVLSQMNFKMDDISFKGRIVISARAK